MNAQKQDPSESSSAIAVSFPLHCAMPARKEISRRLKKFGVEVSSARQTRLKFVRGKHGGRGKKLRGNCSKNKRLGTIDRIL